MSAGAAGVSSGLIYIPGTYADTDELAAVAAVAGRWDRGSDGLLDAIHRCRLAGVDVLGDQYPYTAGSTFLSALLPPAALEGGFDRIKGAARDAEAAAELLAAFPPSTLWEPRWRAARRSSATTTRP